MADGQNYRNLEYNVNIKSVFDGTTWNVVAYSDFYRSQDGTTWEHAQMGVQVFDDDLSKGLALANDVLMKQVIDGNPKDEDYKPIER